MTDRRLLRTGGALTALLTVFHVVIPLGWGDKLAVLSRDDRATVNELAFGLAVLLAMIAYVSLIHTDDLLTTKLGRAVLAWVVVFWLARAVEGIVLGEINAIPIATMCVAAAVLYGTPLVRPHPHEPVTAPPGTPRPSRSAQRTSEVHHDRQ